MKKSHRTSRAVFLFCFCCDARSMQATFADLTNANVWSVLLEAISLEMRNIAHAITSWLLDISYQFCTSTFWLLWEVLFSCYKWLLSYFQVTSMAFSKTNLLLSPRADKFLGYLVVVQGLWESVLVGHKDGNEWMEDVISSILVNAISPPFYKFYIGLHT